MRETVLVVDDSLTVRMDLVDALRDTGLEAIPCASLRDARQALEKHHVSVVILDLILPDGDGLDLLREIRAMNERSIRVVMLSGEIEVQSRILGLTTGADEYLGKPYDSAYLIAKVRELLRKSADGTDDRRPLLLIDDSVTFRETLANALRQAGYSVVVASTGEEGLRVAATVHPSAIIVDGMLPGIDGTTVIRHVRLDAALRGIPCVLVTAAHELEAELRALDAGADAFVHKNEELDVILAKLNVALRTIDVQEDAVAPSLLSPKRILAVDDSPSYRELIAEALRSDGYEVIAARSGEEALELLSVQSVDCVLLDLIMPGLNGKETCQRIKESPGIRDTPVVLLTAAEDRASMLEGLATGADDYIPKSAELDVLKARVRAQLRRRQFEDETRKVRERLLKSELEAAEARAAQELMETRAALVEELEQRNQALAAAYEELQATQAKLVQTAKMASLGSLVAGVAHEVNNPLAFVLSHLATTEKSLAAVEATLGPGAVESLGAGWTRARSRIESMRLGLERIRDLVVKLRTFSRLDEGERKTANIRECIESVLTILEHRLGSRITVRLDIREPEVIECMPGLLNQAIMNLITNSADAIQEEGAISIFAGAQDEVYRIVVEDTGCGISPAHKERVMDPFFTTKPVGEGTGLGLSITDSIIKKHGGTWELTDRPGGGTVATIQLPI